jgi:cytochrome c
MDSFQLNKIFGAVVGTALFIQTINVASDFFYESEEPAKAGYVVPGAEAEAKPAEAAKPAAEQLPDFATAIPAADAMAGAMIAERCAACHDWTKGGPNKIGPNLYGVVGRPKASHPGFTYSPVMQVVGGNWTYSNLFEFLARPAVVMPGTKMTFAGLPRAQDRLNVIAFLRMQADEPAPLP